MALPVTCAPALPSPPPIIVKEMEEMFLRLGFSKAVVLKLVDDQGINSQQTLASLYDEYIATVSNMISEWEDSGQRAPDFCHGCEESKTHGIHVEDNRALFHGL